MRRLLLIPLLVLIACKDDAPTESPTDDTGTPVTDADGDGSPFEVDCDDNDASAYPDATESCDGVDNDCDGTTDESGGTFYADADGDTFGDAAAPIDACAASAGVVADNTDCDDASAEVYPTAAERCDNLDNDCDTLIDEDVQTTWYADADRDGHGDPGASLESCDPPEGYAASADDCDDSRADVYAGATEICDTLDNDCDSQVDEDVTNTYYQDADQDGYGVSDFVTESCDTPQGYADRTGDCDDSNRDINPDAAELCDTLDNDCDGLTDPDSSTDARTWYADADNDSYGNVNYAQTACDRPNGYVGNSRDCDDGDANTYPSAAESCDSADNDCDGAVDEAPVTDGGTWYTDADSDGYGDAGSPQVACAQPSGTVTNSDDCYDQSATAFPGSTATETPLDGIDTDCDGNDFCTDLSCDGLPDLFVGEHYDGNYATTSYVYTQTNGTFSDSYRAGVTTYGSYRSLAEDLDNDGYMDIVVANYYDGSNYSLDSSIFWGGPAGYSDSNRLALPTVGTISVEAEDLNNDGWLDLVFANYYNNSYAVNSYVYWGSSAGFSTSNRTSLTTYGAYDVTTGDFDNDGYGDIAFCSHYDGSSYSTNSYVYWGASTGFSTSNRDSLPTLGCYKVKSADLNADGYEDLIYANYYNGSSHYTTSYIYYGSSTGFSTSYRTALPSYGAVDLTTGDFDADGYIDVAFAGYYGGSWSASAPTLVYWGSALGLSSSVYTSIGSRGAWRVTAEDVDADGYDDLVMPIYYDGSSHTSNSYLYWGSSSGLSDSDRETIPTIGASGVSVGDLDRDGYADLVFNNYYAGTWSTNAPTYIYYGLARGYSTSNRVSLSTWGSWPNVLIVGQSDW